MPLQARVIGSFHYALCSHVFLVLGPSEGVGNNNLSEKSIPPKIFRLVDFPHCPVRDLFHVQLVFAWAVLQTLSGLSGVAPRYT